MPSSKRITLINNSPSTNFLFLAIVLLFSMTRLIHLTILPIFTDEAVYIRWAKMINEDFSNIWIPILIDNKKPLLMWLISIFLDISENPLWAGRFVSVIAGFLSLIGVYLIGIKIHSVRVGCLAALLYTLCPYYLFYDRMSHQAGLLNCFFIWLIWLTLEIFEKDDKKRAGYYWSSGIAIGLSLLTKATAILFVLLPLILKLIFLRKSTFVPWKSLLQTYLLGFLIAGFPYGVLYFTSPDFSVKNIFIPAMHSEGQASTLDILFRIPARIFSSIEIPFDYFTTYLTNPVLFIAIAFFFFHFKNVNQRYLILAFYFLIPYFLLVGTTGGGFSRYYLFCGTPILIWASLALNYCVDFIDKQIPKKFLYLTITPILITAFYPAIAFDIKLLTEPSKTPFISRDYDQYVSGRFSGYGMPEALDYFKKVSSDKKITIFTTPNWGNPADSVHVYLSDYPNITVYTASWVFEHVLLPSDASKIVAKNKYKKNFEFHVSSLSDVYFICNSLDFERNIFLKKNKGFQLVSSFQKPNSNIFTDIYKRI